MEHLQSILRRRLRLSSLPPVGVREPRFRHASSGGQFPGLGSIAGQRPSGLTPAFHFLIPGVHPLQRRTKTASNRTLPFRPHHLRASAMGGRAPPA